MFFDLAWGRALFYPLALNAKGIDPPNSWFMENEAGYLSYQRRTWPLVEVAYGLGCPSPRTSFPRMKWKPEEGLKVFLFCFPNIWKVSNLSFLFFFLLKKDFFHTI